MRKVFPIVLICVGLLMFGVGVWRAFVGVGSTIGSVASTTMIGSPWTTPGTSSADLNPGMYSVYEDVGTGGSRQGSVTVDPDSITVTGPDGAQVVTTCISCGTSTATLTLGSTTYIGVISFTATQAGTYTLESTDPNGAQLVLGPSLAEALRGIAQNVGGAFVWVGTAILGGFLVLAGIIWLIVAAITGRRKSEPVPGIASYGPGAMAPQVPAAGQVATSGPNAGAWYPDPGDPNQLRWWDGRQWTDYRRPR
ncbi:MAG TPA: DUF2510 domain-containing protein [Actinomycetota bacterium]|nr:DUF2510 domain-containing protein [Actinomycetota bacterium]